MERLDTEDASALLTFVSELNDVEDPLPFPPSVLQGLRDVIRCDAAHYSDLDPVRRCSRMDVKTAGDEEYVLLGVLPDECAAAYELYWALRPTHPVCAYRMRTDDWTTPLKASDFVTLAGFRRTAIYDAQYRGCADYWLDFGLAAEPDRTRMFIFTRKGGPDFTERDRLVASLVRPYLEARAKAAEDATRAAAALATVEESTGREPQAIVLCSATGMIEYASRRSRALLKQYLGLDNGRLPTTLLTRDTITLVDDGGRLTIRIARTGALRILLLAEHDRRLERLTAREREVLDGVAHGWTNEEIALDLGLASATVAKHLEHVYQKLGVRTRTAAAAIVSGAGVEPGP
jgi:DNA-binding NarL/FixJ family response regulator